MSTLQISKVNSLDEIKAPIKDELSKFNSHFKNAMKSQAPLLDKIASFLIKRKGKQLRPIFVFLSAKIWGAINKSTYNAATLVELLHTATLIHDDVVDEAMQRRGFLSLRVLWGNKIAVLMGDYLLSRGLLLSINNNETLLLKIVSNAVKEMSEGEILQIEKSRKLDIDEKIYFKIIKQKTASLFAASCTAGAASVIDKEEILNTMYNIGLNTGMAFQIKDDIFDYDNKKNIGKDINIDIKEKKMTLPLIYALNNAGWTEKRKIINIVKNHNTDKKKIKYLLDFVNEKNGIEYAKKIMHKYTEKAYNLLKTLPENEAKKSFEKLIAFTIYRNI